MCFISARTTTGYDFSFPLTSWSAHRSFGKFFQDKQGGLPLTALQIYQSHQSRIQLDGCNDLVEEFFGNGARLIGLGCIQIAADQVSTFIQ